jgi:hypothetical protein
MRRLCEHDRQEDGLRTEKNFDAFDLMVLAVNKNNILKTKEIWEAPSEEETKFIAQEARFDKL